MKEVNITKIEGIKIGNAQDLGGILCSSNVCTV